MTSATMQDPIEFELFKNALLTIADEMSLTIYRTAYSGVLKNNMDYSTALCDAEGRMVAQGLSLPAHLGSIPTAAASIMSVFGSDMQPGDMYILNDPYQGGMHLPDIFVFKPIFSGGRRIALACTICHHGDIGGRVPGSNAADSTEIFQEGIRIPPLHLFRKGERNETLIALLERNVRIPVQMKGDLRAQIAACHIAKKSLLDLVKQHGADKVKLYMQQLLDYSERMTRAALSTFPDGIYQFVDHIDEDGIDPETPVRLQVSVAKKGDGITVDWTGSSPQVKGAINSTLSFTKSSSYCAIRSLLPGSIPNNEGMFRAIKVIAPEGTITNVVPPAACAARGLTGFRMVDCMFGALSQMAPDQVFAGSDGGNTGISIGGYSSDREPFIYVDFSGSAWGGRPYADGLDGNANISSNQASQSVEMTEAELPIQITCYEFIRDAMGPGKYRGGAPYRRDFRLCENEAVLQVRADRRRFRPYGLYGGQPGQPSMNYLNPETDNRPLPAKLTMSIKRGDVLRNEMAGAGGWGDPLERKPDKVLSDIRNELLSIAAARRDYGVVVVENPLRVDTEETKRERERIRSIRGWAEIPAVSFEPSWSEKK